MLPLFCLELSGALIKKLNEAGFSYADDLTTLNNEFLPEVEEILKGFPGSKDHLKKSLKPPESISAFSLLEREKTCKRLVTFSYKLDKLLGGGVPTGKVLELCGAPGSGKTQLCMQLCVSVQLHSSLGGLQAEALYLDTDAGFSPERIRGMQNGCREHCCNVARAHSFPSHVIESLETQQFTDFHYVSVPDYTQLLATVYTLEDFITQHPKIKLVIIDSLAFPFLPMTDMLKRTSLLCRILQHLKHLAAQRDLAVVVTNILTTRISRSEDQLVPALGECVGHLMNCRLMLGYLPLDRNFAGVIFKSPNQQNDSAHFQITEAGIRDIC